MKKKLLITDLDDTLYNWISFFIPSFYAMVDELVNITGLNKTILLKEYKEKHQYYGSVEYPFITLKLPSILSKYEGKSEIEIKENLEEAFHRFNSVRKKTLKLFPNVQTTLEFLMSRGITIIGYTESSQENGYYRLKKLGINEYFKHIYVSESSYNNNYSVSEKVKYVNKKKPNRDVLLNICKEENYNIQEAIYVGDSLTKDIYMAAMAGITSILVNYPKEQNDYYNLLVDITSWTEEDFIREKQLKAIWRSNDMKPDYIITDFSELISIID